VEVFLKTFLHLVNNKEDDQIQTCEEIGTSTSVDIITCAQANYGTKIKGPNVG
jgi:hypothetical protein